MEIKIVQQNLCSYKTQKTKNNMSEIDYARYVENLINRLLETEPDVLMLSEFDYARHKKAVIARLESEYEIIRPHEYKFGENCSIVCIIAVKKEKLKFTKTWRYKQFKPWYRHIAGTLSTTSGNELLKIFFAHVPSAARRLYPNESADEALKKMENKAEALFAAYCFFIENRDGYAFLGGDFNTDADSSDKKFSLFSVFKELYYAAEDTDKEKKKTYENDRLDYALASKSLAPKCDTVPIPTKECGADHDGLCTTIKLTP